MKVFFGLLFIAFLLSCQKKSVIMTHVSSIDIQTVYEDTISIRALEIDRNNNVVASGSEGKYLYYTPESLSIKTRQLTDSIAKTMEFRSISPISDDFLFLSAGSPALIYKYNRTADSVELVYVDEEPDIFYDSMKFWNDLEGIAFGDSVGDCMSVLITRDGGKTWNQLACDEFIPKKGAQEGAFAASNTNIAIVGNQTWLASGSRIFISLDKGHTWEVVNTPIIQNQQTQGIYSIDFYNKSIGVGIGGDYTNPEDNLNNIIVTDDGGKNWKTINSNTAPGYRSCIQFIPESNGKGLLTVGFKGIDSSTDGGQTWTHLSDESFYTVRFTTANSGYLAGKDRLAFFKLH